MHRSALFAALALLVSIEGHACFAQDHVLSGAGATFPAPLYAKWFRSFEQHHPGLKFEYRTTGSEAGVQELQAGTVDFAASDMPLPEGQVLQLPSTLGAVVPIYHLENPSQDLRFTPEVLAGIFLGRITRWNDPALRALNRGVHLPDRAIAVVHRSDGSGTTYVLSDFLSKTSSDWRAGIVTGTTIAWPTGVGAPGNEGVAEKVKQTPDSIGYVEFIYALENRLSYGLVKNQAGHFVQAGLDSIGEAARSAASGQGPVSITNAPGANAYPVSSFTYLLIPAHPREPWKRQAMREFLDWMLSSGQKQSASLGYGSLPPEIVAWERGVLEKIQ